MNNDKNSPANNPERASSSDDADWFNKDDWWKDFAIDSEEEPPAQNTKAARRSQADNKARLQGDVSPAPASASSGWGANTPPISFPDLKKYIPYAVCCLILAAGAGGAAYFNSLTQPITKKISNAEAEIIKKRNHIKLYNKIQAPLHEAIAATNKERDELKRLIAERIKSEKELTVLRDEYGAAAAEAQQLKINVEWLEQKLKVKKTPIAKQVVVVEDEEKKVEDNKGEVNKDKNKEQTQQGKDKPDIVAPPDEPPVKNPPEPEEVKDLALNYLYSMRDGDPANHGNCFSPVCVVKGAILTKEAIVKDAQDFWEKYPTRNYTLKYIACNKYSIQLMYIYEYTNRSNKKVKGYVTEKWDIDPDRKITNLNQSVSTREPKNFIQEAKKDGYRVFRGK